MRSRGCQTPTSFLRSGGEETPVLPGRRDAYDKAPDKGRGGARGRRRQAADNTGVGNTTPRRAESPSTHGPPANCTLWISGERAGCRSHPLYKCRRRTPCTISWAWGASQLMPGMKGRRRADTPSAPPFPSSHRSAFSRVWDSCSLHGRTVAQYAFFRAKRVITRTLRSKRSDQFSR